MKSFLDKFWFRLILILITSFFITEIGSTDSLFSRLSDFLKEYLATVIISIGAVELVYFINARLQRRIPWGQGHTWLRVLLQILLAWLVPVILVLCMATVYFRIYGVDITRTDYMYNALPVVMLFLLSLNIVFITAPTFLLVFQNKEMEGETHNQKITKPLKRIKIEDGKSMMMLEPKQIKGAYMVNKRVVLRNSKDEEVLTDLTLDELEKEYLPPDSFFRINRQLIASRANCIEYKPLDYGKLEIQLSIPVPVDTIVSQLKAKAFKEWIID